ncbi:MAG: hypothetical protein ACFFBD_00440 [Candidatus Hodarchaeota archaeon]
MTKNPNAGTLKSGWEEGQEILTAEEEPVRLESIGRPAWWFNGSLFVPKTQDQRRLATLQYQITTKHEKILSSRATRIQQLIGLLSEWFPVPVLDAIGKEILLDTDLRQSKDELVIHFLGALEAALRQRYNTIRWAVLQEINKATEQSLTKKDIYKYMFYTRQRKKERAPDTLRIVQHLTIEELTKEPLSIEQKRTIVCQVIQAVKILRSKNFICKDPEVAAWALKRILLNEKGTQTSVPKDLRFATTRLTHRLRKCLGKEKAPKD